VIERLSAAQACMQGGDAECARRALDEVAALENLSVFEAANLHNLEADLSHRSDDVDGAIGAYESLLGLPREDVPPSVLQQALRNVAMLYVRQERYEAGLEAFDAWLDLPETMPTADDHYTKASILYRLGRYQAAVRPLELAIAAADAPDASWYQLLEYLRSRVR